MTAPARTRRARVVPTPAPQKPPEAFIIPTAILVEVLKLVGSIPAGQVGATFLQLQQLEPVPSTVDSGE